MGDDLDGRDIDFWIAEARRVNRHDPMTAYEFYRAWVAARAARDGQCNHTTYAAWPMPPAVVAFLALDGTEREKVLAKSGQPCARCPAYLREYGFPCPEHNQLRAQPQPS